MERKVTLELTVQQLNIVLGGIVKLPIDYALSTLNEIQRQADSQLGPANGQVPSGPLANKIVN